MSGALVVGPGRAGSAVAARMAAAGEATTLLGRRRGAWQARARRAGISARTRLPAGHDPAVVVLAVADEDLAGVAADLAASLPPRRGRLVVHLSGLHGLEALAPFAAGGARTAALHPVVPFPPPGGDGAVLRGAPVTLLAARGSAAAARRLVRSWGARPVELTAGADRRRYHLALALAANHLTALVGWSEELLAEAGGPAAADLASELAGRALEAVREHGAAAALTGPVARGDAGTLRQHLAALRGPERRRYVDQLRGLIAFAAGAGRLDAATARRLRRLLGE